MWSLRTTGPGMALVSHDRFYCTTCATIFWFSVGFQGGHTDVSALQEKLRELRQENSELKREVRALENDIRRASGGEPISDLDVCISI